MPCRIKKLIFLTPVLFLIFIFAYPLWVKQGANVRDSIINEKFLASFDEEIVTGSSCPIEKESKVVRGSSLEPLLKEGEEITALIGYYDCHQVQRGDGVLIRYAGNENPLLKIVKAIPGDKWGLKENNEGFFEIIVSGEALKNSQGEVYQIPKSKIKMLELYKDDYPIIPEHTFLVLGEKIDGSFDSVQFGLIDKSYILGKAEF